MSIRRGLIDFAIAIPVVIAVSWLFDWLRDKPFQNVLEMWGSLLVALIALWGGRAFEKKSGQ